MTIGRARTITLKQARKKAKRRLFEVSDGKDPAHQRRADRETIKVAELGEEFLKLLNLIWTFELVVAKPSVI